tara:strand:- start:133 stop:624 length:492 start_codon:yes stop_codon:yes gene_type:complete
LPERFTLIKEFLMEQNLSTLNNWPAYHNLDDEQDAQDHFIVRDGVSCAGAHLIVDVWGADQLDDLELMERAMREAVEAAKATLLHIHLHHFTPNGGISGVAVLAESHISVHTWPERQFAAFDIFMCGDAKPELAVEVLRTHFHPGQFQVQELLRGRTGSYGDI